MNVIGKIKTHLRLNSSMHRKSTNRLSAFCSINKEKKVNSKMLAKLGFTLAEVLIVIGLIGLVAEMTIPTLIANVNEEVTIVSLKKTYSILSSAYELAVQDNGTPNSWTADPMAILKPYLKTIKDCSDRSSDCFAPGVTYKLVSGINDPYKDGRYDISGQASLKLADGVNLMYELDNAACANDAGTLPSLKVECGQIYVDVNGDKGPNQWGKDAFLIYLTNLGIVPFGTDAETLHTFSSQCQSEGYACSGWVIYNGNMDYLNCAGLAWGGKTKCN